jgi:hypothetical protein
MYAHWAKSGGCHILNIDLCHSSNTVSSNLGGMGGYEVSIGIENSVSKMDSFQGGKFFVLIK